MEKHKREISCHFQNDLMKERVCIHEWAWPGFRLKFQTFVINIRPKSVKTFVIDLGVFTKNLRPVLGLAKGITLSLPLGRFSLKLMPKVLAFVYKFK